MLIVSPRSRERNAAGWGNGTSGVDDDAASTSLSCSACVTGLGSKSPRRILAPCRSTTIDTPGALRCALWMYSCRSPVERCDALTRNWVAPARASSASRPIDAGPSVTTSPGAAGVCSGEATAWLEVTRFELITRECSNAGSN